MLPSGRDSSTSTRTHAVSHRSLWSRPDRPTGAIPTDSFALKQTSEAEMARRRKLAEEERAGAG